ncbi:MAG: phosphatidate cytidylyltransferase [Lachnospiraceae bacterium]|nr:phosphatidate cytidylyltransferase [Lachnospiraceae bacterium]
MLTRFISGIILLALIIVTGILGGWFFYCMVLLISAAALWEFYRMAGIDKKPVGIAGYVTAAVLWVVIAFGWEDYLPFVLIFGFFSIMGVYASHFVPTEVTEPLYAFFGLFYTVFLLSFMYRIRMMNDGVYLLWLILLGSWGCDLSAYCIGIVFGKHKMAPDLSPKKTIEGAVGGVVGAALLGAMYGALFGSRFSVIDYPVIACGIACAAAALISMIGDLAASAFKRSHNIKDYSKLLPGHGGILDRFDSVIFVAPVIFFVVNFFIR